MGDAPTKPGKADDATVSPAMADGFNRALDEAGRFFMGQADVHRALEAVVALLERERIPYAIAGAMAMNLHGFRRVTEDVDLILSRESLAAFKAVALGHGYVEKYPGSKGVRDTVNNVGLDFLLVGDFPGDGKPKPVAFPDPSIAVRVPRGTLLIATVPLAKLIELKLASGMSAPHRLKDLADVVELIRKLKLERGLGHALDPSVRGKYDELWIPAQVWDPIAEE
ncbi:MAG TPA: hypothetical protein VGO62_18140 [Myxococcota bacterium]|jgi:hypothetical protein